MSFCTYFLCRPTGSFQSHRLRLAEFAEEYDEYPIASEAATTAHGLSGSVFHERRDIHEPSWLGLIKALTDEDLAIRTIGANHQAVVLVSYQEHTFLLAYGYAHSIAKKLSVERKFGRVVVSNAKEENEIRAFSAQIYGANPKSRVERRGKGGTLLQLEIPRRINNLKSLAAKVVVDKPMVIEGGVGLRFESPRSLFHLTQIFDLLIGWWNKGLELDEELAKLDRLEEVTDEVVLETLNCELDRLILSDEDVQLGLCLDSEEIWNATKHEYIVNRKRYLMPILDANYFRMALQYASESFVDIQKVRMQSLISDRKTPLTTLLRDQLVYESPVEIDGKIYVFDDGIWSNVKINWAQSARDGLKSLLKNTEKNLPNFLLPDYSVKIGAGGENTYLDLLPEIFIGSKWRSLHTKFPPSPLPRQELCDICIDGRIFLHVKRGLGFESVAEVCWQAMQSCNIFAEDQKFRDWASKALLQPSGWSTDLNQRKSVIFGIALITNRIDELPKCISLRAADCLAEFASQVGKLDFEPVLVFIEDKA